MYNNIPLTKETIDIYKAHLENGSYEDDTYATLSLSLSFTRD